MPVAVFLLAGAKKKTSRSHWRIKERADHEFGTGRDGRPSAGNGRRFAPATGGTSRRLRDGRSGRSVGTVGRDGRSGRSGRTVGTVTRGWGAQARSRAGRENTVECKFRFKLIFIDLACRAKLTGKLRQRERVARELHGELCQEASLDVMGGDPIREPGVLQASKI